MPESSCEGRPGGFLRYLTVAYLKFRSWQKKHGTHPNFHGSRDIYGVSKFIYKHMLQIKHYDTSAKSKELIKTRHRKKLQRSRLPVRRRRPMHQDLDHSSLMKVSKEAFAVLSESRNLEIHTIRTPTFWTRSHLKALTKCLATSKIYAGTEIFKKLFLNEMKNDTAVDLFKTELPIRIRSA